MPVRDTGDCMARKLPSSLWRWRSKVGFVTPPHSHTAPDSPHLTSALWGVGDLPSPLCPQLLVQDLHVVEGVQWGLVEQEECASLSWALADLSPPQVFLVQPAAGGRALLLDQPAVARLTSFPGGPCQCQWPCSFRPAGAVSGGAQCIL